MILDKRQTNRDGAITNSPTIISEHHSCFTDCKVQSRHECLILIKYNSTYTKFQHRKFVEWKFHQDKFNQNYSAQKNVRVFSNKLFQYSVAGTVTSFERSRPERLTPRNLTFSDCIHLIISVRVNSVLNSSSSFLLFRIELIPSISPWKIPQFCNQQNRFGKTPRTST